jgi:polar amino acid transport system permease protein
MLLGTVTTVKVLICATILYVIISIIFGLMRISNNLIIQGVATVYIEFFRGTSLLVQLFWFYYVLPFFGISLEAFTAGVVAIGMNFGAYGAEIVRGGILAVPRGQWEGAFRIELYSSKKNEKNNYTTNISNNFATSRKLNCRAFKSYSISGISHRG